MPNDEQTRETWETYKDIPILKVRGPKRSTLYRAHGVAGLFEDPESIKRIIDKWTPEYREMTLKLYRLGAWKPQQSKIADKSRGHARKKSRNMNPATMFPPESPEPPSDAQRIP